ncbi:Aspartic peptidase [Gossypium australe]|uniref:Aspartic peptidase n=1 Tax=Gossypium australe TaxID=47621 RepID=A0A5B6WDK3_9ROSI|nr:Aspartic peptidase [Gossypium australe]
MERAEDQPTKPIPKNSEEVKSKLVTSDKLTPVSNTNTIPQKSCLVQDKAPSPPYPQKLKKKKYKMQFKKFLDVLKQLHINIPLVEALEQIPNYVKFMKDILSKKMSLENSRL